MKPVLITRTSSLSQIRHCKFVKKRFTVYDSDTHPGGATVETPAVRRIPNTLIIRDLNTWRGHDGDRVRHQVETPNQTYG